MQQFKVFRALGMTFRAWFRNFIPFTLLAAILYAPMLVWTFTLPGADDTTYENIADVGSKYELFFTRGTWVLVGLAALLSPLITYRVIEDMNGRRVSLGTSIKHGLRGIIPAVLLAAATNGIQLLPAGGILSTILLCYWFVVAPAAVVERLGAGGAIQRSVALTSGRRGGIFGMCLLVGLVVVVGLVWWVMPLFDSTETDPHVLGHLLKRTAWLMVGTVAVTQLFTGIMQAVSYTLLRVDKDGVSTEELAKVFE
jgi:hypothetical protein